MSLQFDISLGAAYRSKPQQVRVMSEAWAAANLRCPACDGVLERYCNNRPAADLLCQRCHEDFEVKSQAKAPGRILADGAYRTMMERISGASAPNFLILHYARPKYAVENVVLIPKHYMNASCIVRRAPLRDRPNCILCNIDLDRIPPSGRIALVAHGQSVERAVVSDAWQQTIFLRDRLSSADTGWLIAVMNVVELLNKRDFTLAEIYRSSPSLQALFPGNANVKAKIRQQLQILRDRGYLTFQGGGNYSRTHAGGLGGRLRSPDLASL